MSYLQLLYLEKTRKEFENSDKFRLEKIFTFCYKFEDIIDESYDYIPHQNAALAVLADMDDSHSPNDMFI